MWSSDKVNMQRVFFSFFLLKQSDWLCEHQIPKVTNVTWYYQQPSVKYPKKRNIPCIACIYTAPAERRVLDGLQWAVLLLCKFLNICKRKFPVFKGKKNIPAAGGQELGVGPQECRCGVQWSMCQTEVWVGARTPVEVRPTEMRKFLRSDCFRAEEKRKEKRKLMKWVESDLQRRPGSLVMRTKWVMRKGLLDLLGHYYYCCLYYTHALLTSKNCLNN